MCRLSLLALSTVALGISATPLLADNHHGENIQGKPHHMHGAMHGDGHVPMYAEDLLAAYYAKLEKRVDLPVAPANVSLSPDATITRLAFGSCNHQLRPQTYWATIAETDPDLFLFIGDNNYGDQGWDGDAALTTLRKAYKVQAETAELAAFRSQVPMMITWDDHDYGFNDGGGSFAFKGWAETIFETFWNASDEVKSRPGIYESRMFGEKGKRTQVIMLDTRFFRSDLETMPYQMNRPALGPYQPSDNASKTMLGESQWQWLEQELAKPADLRIVVSSIQVITDAHNYEAWENLPLERQKLYAMLAGREESGLVLLSGDRHAGGIYSDTPEAAGGEQVWELTSSSLNYSFSSTERNTAREPDPKRLTDFISEENFGLVEIDWAAKTFTMSLRGATEGETRVTRTVGW
ncbi:alkaline phosphatase D family protein [Erythrobacter sp. THAF29]|uniref:alkaline phosphatase D family protein n=1 Tax=Erythrobacter sp. THAF29 TaxID=2587851 RepID=UPI001267B25D|nr:alkaline phosphatase D family protein [Erythrobacter sp. THAF29]QFT77165.1 Alkaline phosphatase D precursor [Erythrobacter sp. THAF29]